MNDLVLMIYRKNDCDSTGTWKHTFGFNQRFYIIGLIQRLLTSLFIEIIVVNGLISIFIQGIGTN